jgi:hypothetical protein
LRAHLQALTWLCKIYDTQWSVVLEQRPWMLEVESIPDELIDCKASIIMESQPVHAVLQPYSFNQSTTLKRHDTGYDCASGFPRPGVIKPRKAGIDKFSKSELKVSRHFSHKIHPYWILIYGGGSASINMQSPTASATTPFLMEWLLRSRLLLHQNRLRHPYHTGFALLRRLPPAVHQNTARLHLDALASVYL